MIRFSLGVFTLVWTLPAVALDLNHAWSLLKTRGATYQAAMYERAAGQEYRALGRAGLLPQVSASGYQSLVRGETEEPDIFGRTQRSDLDYDSRGAIVQLRQPLFNWQKYAEYLQGDQRALYSDAVYKAKAQNLAIQLAGRYFDVLLARETILLAEAKVKAFEELRAAAKRRYELGEGTVTDIDEAAARRDLAHADLIEAEDALLVARRALQEMLGQMPDEVASLNDNRFPTPPLEPSTMAAWVSKAEADNPVVHARQRALDVADQEVSRTYGDHLPTLDLVLSYNANDSDSVSTRNQRNRYGQAGLQLNIPIFTGGRVSAQARQAVANRNKASEELYATREEVISNTTREFRGVQSSEARIRALETAIVSSERALYSTRKGMQAGTSTNIDILNAEEQVYDARRNLLEAKLKYLLARLRLAAEAGSLGDAEINWANGYLGPTLPL